ncbi:rhoGEF domain-containing protein [Diplocarpon mali]|nr:rhoGEF domain-containing protein [Diplocarpon mali]
MADPLSVAASIAGLLTAAQLVSVGISKVVSGHRSGSREIKDIKTIVDTLRKVLLQLQMLLLSRASVDPKRASLIMVDEVVTTLTACVMTFSDLDGCVKGLETDEQLGLLDSVKWVSKASELEGYLRNLEAHKSSLILMTNILTCQSAHNAESAAGQLKVLMVTVIQSNQQLARRMATMERSIAPSTIGPEDNDSSSILSQDTVRNATVSASTNPSVHPAFGFSFEEDLQTSWKAGNKVETITLPKGLRLLGRSSSSRRKLLIKEGISSPVFISSTYTQTSDTRRLPLVPDLPLPNFEENTSQGDLIRSQSGIFHSAVHRDDEDVLKNEDGLDPVTRSGTGYNVLYLAASLFEFHLSATKSEAGYPYLTYQAGEIFDVIAEKGELWLAKNQDDPTDSVGWLWSKHFARLSRDDSYQEDDGAFTLSPPPEIDKKGKKVAREGREPRSENLSETLSAEEDSSLFIIPTIVVGDGSTIATKEETERTDEIVNQSEELRQMYDQFDLSFG